MFLPNTKTRKWCAVDAEGDVGRRGLLGVAFYSDIVQNYITNHDEIKNVLLFHAKEGYTFLCHNASYDLPVVWGQLGLKPEYTYYNDRLHHGSWKYSKSASAAQIWDTLDLSGGLKLEKLGNDLGIPKYPTPQKLLGIEPDKYEWKCDLHDTWECEYCYAVRDAEIVYKFMDGLTTLLAGWGVKPGPRISGIALEVWKALDLVQGVGLQSKKLATLARKAYYGGRTECFKYGYLTPCYTADVTSMYPSVMLETPFPDPNNLIHLQNIPVASFPRNCEGVAKVDISVPPMHVPPLPYTMKQSRVYPIGRLVGTWTILEIRHALELGCTINKVYEVAYATSTLQPFTQFIGVLWALREAYKGKGDSRELFAKLLMNNLYGRLGAREQPERTIIKPAPKGYDSRTSKIPYDTSWVAETLYLSNTTELDFGRDWTNVLWAAQITSAARVKLHKLMLLQGVNLAYCDTDSIFSTQPVQGTSEGLGKLKTEGQFQSAIIVQPKLYALQDFEGEWQPKAKGVTRSVALRFLQGHSVTFPKPVKPKEALRNGIEAGTWILVSKHRHDATYRRQPRNVVALLDDFGYSDTDPLVNGPLTDYTQHTRTS